MAAFSVAQLCVLVVFVVAVFLLVRRREASYRRSVQTVKVAP
jgi:hypothetical protein